MVKKIIILLFSFSIIAQASDSQSRMEKRIYLAGGALYLMACTLLSTEIGVYTQKTVDNWGINEIPTDNFGMVVDTKGFGIQHQGHKQFKECDRRQGTIELELESGKKLISVLDNRAEIHKFITNQDDKIIRAKRISNDNWSEPGLSPESALTYQISTNPCYNKSSTVFNNETLSKLVKESLDMASTYSFLRFYETDKKPRFTINIGTLDNPRCKVIGEWRKYGRLMTVPMSKTKERLQFTLIHEAIHVLGHKHQQDPYWDTYQQSGKHLPLNITWNQENSSQAEQYITKGIPRVGQIKNAQSLRAGEFPMQSSMLYPGHVKINGSIYRSFENYKPTKSDFLMMPVLGRPCGLSLEEAMLEYERIVQNGLAKKMSPYDMAKALWSLRNQKRKIQPPPPFPEHLFPKEMPTYSVNDPSRFTYNFGKVTKDNIHIFAKLFLSFYLVAVAALETYHYRNNIKNFRIRIDYRMRNLLKIFSPKNFKLLQNEIRDIYQEIFQRKQERVPAEIQRV